MMMHPICVAIHVTPVEIQVNSGTKFTFMSRHGPKWHDASNAVLKHKL